ncbi:PP2C family protein-serine/threonine phosphatase [Nocardiopsis nanhaiensis]
MNSIEAVFRVLRSARPDGLLTALRGVLGAEYAAVWADLLLADYGMTVLCHVSDEHRESVHYSVFSSTEGRVFGSQQPLAEHRSGPDLISAYLPVTVRGDRLGVLVVTFHGQQIDPRTLEDLSTAAEALGHELLVAERDTDFYRRIRRRHRLTLAAEMQWDLLAGRAYECLEYSLGAQLEPAYAIRGDNFDWSVGHDRLLLSITNGMGEGIEASLLTSLAVNALRNARRGGVPLADQVALADKAVYAEYGGTRHVDVLLLAFDVATGETEAVDAGSPRLYVQREDAVFRQPFEAQMPVGMAQDTVFSPQRFTARPGDRMVFVSDGVFDADNRTGERFGDRALSRAILATRLLPAASVPGEVLRILADFREGGEREDDTLVLCLDWRGTADGPIPESADPDAALVDRRREDIEVGSVPE